MRLLAVGGEREDGGTGLVRAGNAAMSHKSTTTSPEGAERSCIDSLSSGTFTGLLSASVLVTQEFPGRMWNKVQSNTTSS